MSDKGSLGQEAVQGTGSWQLIQCWKAGGPQDSTSCDVGEDLCGVFPRMYVWWDPLSAGCIVGAMNTGCLFMKMVPLQMAYGL